MNGIRLPLLKYAVLASCVTVAAAAQAEEIKLRWGHYLPNSGFVQIEKDFARKIEERTDGQVKIEITFAGGLGKGPEVAMLAGRGAIDMASVAPGYYPDQLLFWKACQIPFIFNEPKQAIDILYKSYQEFPTFKEELDRMNVIYLFQQPLGSYYMTGPDPNCDTVEGLAGKKIRSFGADLPKMHAAIGAVPVTVRPTEVYEALQRGTIDYSFLNVGNVESLRLYEPGKYNCGTVMTIAGHLIVIGKRSWEKLPADVQDIFMDQARKSQRDYLDWLETGTAASITKIEKAGGVFKEFPATELAKWMDATPDLLKGWEESMAGRGLGEQADQVAAAWRAWAN
ncbi:MAG: TRAP transporter substrate-binding protein DctP [Alphaproteobacteria bacterium]|nr:TRAP transporter substrate-binding protein DctP [Alphaproteobacteria bacterium]